MRVLEEDTMRQILGNSTELLGVVDDDGRFTWTSPNWKDVLGHDEAPLRRLHPDALIHRDDLADATASLRLAIEGHPVPTRVDRYRHRDGSWRHLEWTAHSSPMGAIWVGRDVTERQRREAERNRQLTQLLMAEELAGVGHWQLDLADSSLFWSPQVFAIHGRAPGLGEPPLALAIDYYHPDDRATVQAVVGRAVEHGEPFAFQARLIGEDSVERQVVSRGRAEIVGGKTVRIFGVFQDLTETYQVQQRLHRAERLASVGTLAASVAHEINNPLSYVQLNTGFLLEEIQGLRELSSARRSEMEELLDDLRDGVNRITRIVAGLKGFSKTRESESSPVDLGQVMRTALRLCRNEIEHAGEIRMAERDGPMTVMADESQLVQVVVNLLMNASHAARPQVPLRIEMVTRRCAQGWTCIEVRDNGIGMSEAVQKRITEPFFTTRGKGSGTGLGLFVSTGIAEALGGRLDITSEVDVGTRVRVVLPELDEVREEDPVEASLPPPSRLGRVLVIDDQLRVARSVARAVRPHEAVIETDPVRALERLKEPGAAGIYDLVLCDLMMPVLHGQQVFQMAPPELQERFLFLTGGAFTPGAEDFAATMSDRVLAKPPDRATLRQCIEDALERQVPVHVRKVG